MAAKKEKVQPLTFRDRSLQLLIRRTDRLAKLLAPGPETGGKPSAPTVLIGQAAALVLDAALGYCGPSVLEKFLELYIRGSRTYGGFCPECGESRNKVSDKPCAKCEKRFKQEMEDKEHQEKKTLR